MLQNSRIIEHEKHFVLPVVLYILYCKKYRSSGQACIVTHVLHVFGYGQNKHSMQICYTNPTKKMQSPGSVFIIHSQEHSFSVSPRFANIGCSTTSDWLNHSQSEVVLHSNASIEQEHACRCQRLAMGCLIENRLSRKRGIILKNALSFKQISSVITEILQNIKMFF